MGDAVRLPEHVPVAPGDLRPSTLGDPADARKCDGVGVVVDADLSRALACRSDYMGALDAFRDRESVREPCYTSVAGVGDVWEQEIEIEA
jgi:hypothetical protein